MSKRLHANLIGLAVLGSLLSAPLAGCSSDDAESESASNEVERQITQASSLEPEDLVREFVYAMQIGDQKQGEALCISRANSDKLYPNVIPPNEAVRRVLMGAAVTRLAVGDEIPESDIPIHLTLAGDADTTAAPAEGNGATDDEADAESDADAAAEPESGAETPAGESAAPTVVTDEYVNENRMLLVYSVGPGGKPQLFALVKQNDVWLVDPAPQIAVRMRPRVGNRRAGP